MPAREAVAGILAPLLLAAIIWLPPWVFLTVLGAAVTAAGWELLAMAAGSGLAVLRWPATLALAATLAAAWIAGTGGLLISLVAAGLLLPTLQLAHPRRPEGSLAGTAVGLFTVVYLGASGACLGWLRAWPADGLGVRLILLYLLVIWIGDSGAYYVGKTWGRHRMSPRISPKKTWEGLAGGVAATFLAAAALRAWFLPELAWLHTLAVAAILAAAAPVGDLVESQIKRDTGVKDSSGLLPGHGGLLDRTDSLVYAAPPVLGYLLLVGFLG